MSELHDGERNDPSTRASMGRGLVALGCSVFAFVALAVPVALYGSLVYLQPRHGEPIRSAIRAASDAGPPETEADTSPD